MTSLRTDLAAWIERVTGAAVTAAEPIGAGASRRTWGIQLADGRELVVREDTGRGPVAGSPLDLAREAAVYRALAPSGLPVPSLLGVAPDATAMLLERATGIADLTAVDEDERVVVGCDYLRCLGGLHLLDVDDLDLGPLTVPVDGPSHALLEIELWESILETVPDEWASPAASFGLSWLRRHAPGSAAHTSLCHGDAGPLNFLYEGGRVTAMLDWEFAHVGDPHDDLAWVVVRDRLLRTQLDVPAAFAAWSETTGLSVDADVLAYYQALVLVRMLVSCDATLRWTGVEECDENKTQLRLRPHLSNAISHALQAAGCDEPELEELGATR